MDEFKKIFLENNNVFHTYNFYITFNEKICTDKIKTNCILLPIDNKGNVYRQNQTSIKITSDLNEFYELCDMCEVFKDNIIRYKLGGIVVRKFGTKDKIKNFKYYEYHEKFNYFPKKEYNTQYSFSKKKNNIYSTKRIYDRHQILLYDRYEVCIYDEQLIPFEDRWLINQNNNIKSLQIYMTKNNITFI